MRSTVINLLTMCAVFVAVIVCPCRMQAAAAKPTISCCAHGLNTPVQPHSPNCPHCGTAAVVVDVHHTLIDVPVPAVSVALIDFPFSQSISAFSTLRFDSISRPPPPLLSMQCRLTL